MEAIVQEKNTQQFTGDVVGFDTRRVISCYPELEKDLGPLGCEMIAALADVSVAKGSKRECVINTTAEFGGVVSVFIPDRDLPARYIPRLLQVARLVKKASQGKQRVHLVLSGGQTTGMCTDGIVRSRRDLCGEVNAYTMSAEIRKAEAESDEDLFNWTSGVTIDADSLHTGDQAAISPPLFWVKKTRLLVILTPVEHSARLYLKMLEGLKIWVGRTYPDSDLIRDWFTKLKMICEPIYTLDGLGWGGVCGRYITLAADAFGPKIDCPTLSGVGLVDHKVGGENRKLLDEMRGTMKHPCPNTPFEIAKDDPRCVVEFGPVDSSWF